MHTGARTIRVAPTTTTRQRQNQNAKLLAALRNIDTAQHGLDQDGRLGSPNQLDRDQYAKTLSERAAAALKGATAQTISVSSAQPATVEVPAFMFGNKSSSSTGRRVPLQMVFQAGPGSPPEIDTPRSARGQRELNRYASVATGLGRAGSPPYPNVRLSPRVMSPKILSPRGSSRNLVPKTGTAVQHNHVNSNIGPVVPEVNKASGEHNRSLSVNRSVSYSSLPGQTKSNAVPRQKKSDLRESEIQVSPKHPKSPKGTRRTAKDEETKKATTPTTVTVVLPHSASTTSTGFVEPMKPEKKEKPVVSVKPVKGEKSDKSLNRPPEKPDESEKKDEAEESDGQEPEKKKKKELTVDVPQRIKPTVPKISITKSVSCDSGVNAESLATVDEDNSLAMKCVQASQKGRKDKITVSEHSYPSPVKSHLSGSAMNSPRKTSHTPQTPLSENGHHRHQQSRDYHHHHHHDDHHHGSASRSSNGLLSSSKSSRRRSRSLAVDLHSLQEGYDGGSSHTQSRSSSRRSHSHHTHRSNSRRSHSHHTHSRSNSRHSRSHHYRSGSRRSHSHHHSHHHRASGRASSLNAIRSSPLMDVDDLTPKGQKKVDSQLVHGVAVESPDPEPEERSSQVFSPPLHTEESCARLQERVSGVNMVRLVHEQSQHMKKETIRQRKPKKEESVSGNNKPEDGKPLEVTFEEPSSPAVDGENDQNKDGEDKPNEDDGKDDSLLMGKIRLMRWPEIIRFGVMTGLNLNQWEYEKYVLYLMLARSPARCNYIDVYSEWLVIGSVLAYFISLIGVYLTDNFTRRQNIVYQICLIGQTVLLFGMYACTITGHLVWANVFYQIRQACVIQSMSSFTKLLKLRLDVETSRNKMKLTIFRNTAAAAALRSAMIEYAQKKRRERPKIKKRHNWGHSSLRRTQMKALFGKKMRQSMYVSGSMDNIDYEGLPSQSSAGRTVSSSDKPSTDEEETRSVDTGNGESVVRKRGVTVASAAPKWQSSDSGGDSEGPSTPSSPSRRQFFDSDESSESGEDDDDEWEMDFEMINEQLQEITAAKLAELVGEETAQLLEQIEKNFEEAEVNEDLMLKDGENVIISSVGNFGEVFGCLVELACLLVMYLAMPDLLLKDACDISMGILVGMNALIAILSFTIFSSDLTDPLAEVTQKNEKKKGGKEEMDVAQPGEDPAKKDSEEEPKPGCCDKTKALWKWFFVRIKYMFTTKVVVNIMVHLLIINLLYFMMSYPVTIFVNIETDESSSSLSSSSSSLDFFSSESYGAIVTFAEACDGTVFNLIEQCVTTNIISLVTSFLYSFTLVRCPPRYFYPFVQPVLCLVCVADLICLMYLRQNMGRLLLTFLVAVASQFAYSLNVFSDFVFNTAILSDYYGFVVGVDSLGFQTVSLVTSSLLYSKVELETLVWTCCGLLVVIIIHGIIMSRIFADPNWDGSLQTTEKTLEEAPEQENGDIVIDDDDDDLDDFRNEETKVEEKETKDRDSYSDGSLKDDSDSGGEKKKK